MSEALDLLYGIRLEDGTCWGECATDWQRADAAAFLDASGPRSHFWTRPRGASKTSDAGFGSTVALVVQLPPGARGYCVAADRDQAALLVQAWTVPGGALKRCAAQSTYSNTRSLRRVRARRWRSSPRTMQAPGAFGLT